VYVVRTGRTKSRRTPWSVSIRVAALLLPLALWSCDRGRDLTPADHGDHGPAGTFGTVHFEISCSADAQRQFDRAVAMLHSFFYPETEKAFAAIVEHEPSCAMGYWGIAISQRPNPLTAPFPPQLLERGRVALQQARQAGAPTQRERDWIDALVPFFEAHDTVDQQTRTARYEAAMERLHQRYPTDSEVSIFYALALLEAVDLTDKTYASQLKAASILEELQKAQPTHPGVVHYLIHAYDYAPIAAKGLPAARRYAALAPSAPHALHMPSHIFTRLGYWDESIASNRAARAAGEAEGDVGEALHAMDYLTYAYLQLGQDADAERVVADVRGMTPLAAGKFKIGYAANAIAIRFAIERRQWDAAAKLAPLPGSEPQVAAIVYWANAIGHARSGHPEDATADIAKIDDSLGTLHGTDDKYWIGQTEVLASSARAWQLSANGKKDEAIAQLRAAADAEDATEKRPVTPGPIVPAREQLGDMLLEQGRGADALREFKAALAESPNRRGALMGAARAAELAGDSETAKAMRAQISSQSASNG